MGGASQTPVIRVTEHPVQLWHNCCMKNVGSRVNVLKVSAELRASLEVAGCKKRHAAAEVLFREDGESIGVFLVRWEGAHEREKPAEFGPGFRCWFVAGAARNLYRTAVQPYCCDPYGVCRALCAFE